MPKLSNLACTLLTAGLLASGLLAAPGCSRQTDPSALQLADLTADERTFVGRMVTLERAKAVALVDRPLGDTLLDSLATAWGDSALGETAALVPTDPVRAGQVANFLHRVLEAELDSLLLAPRPDRLAAPLPDPPPGPEGAGAAEAEL